MQKKVITSINGPVILAKGEGDFAMHDIVYIGKEKILGDVIKIKNDIKWSDGNQFSVEDVLFTIDVLKQIPSIYGNNVQYIVGVEKIDDDTYQVQVVSWYDNENSYTSQMVRTIKYFAELEK